MVRFQGIWLCGLQVCLENDELKVTPQILEPFATMNEKTCLHNDNAYLSAQMIAFGARLWRVLHEYGPPQLNHVD
jgi:hypothetical protein